jgi:perosamine synthetase
MIEKIRVAKAYRDCFQNTDVQFHEQEENTVHSYWMCSILIEDANLRDPLIEYMRLNGIDSRPLFYPCHTLPMYANGNNDFPVVNNLSYRGLNLPSYPELTNDDVAYISQTILKFLQEPQKSKFNTEILPDLK